MNLTDDLLALATVPGIGPRVQRELLSRCPAAEVLARPADHADILPAAAVAAIRHGEPARNAADQRRLARAVGAAIVGLDEPGYPPLLRRVYDPPPVLFVRGVLDAAPPHPVALVGARAASPAGRALARSMARQLGAAGATVVSGLARGIDGEAHQGALEAGASTLAVLGSGVDRVYPPEHAPLARRIEHERGALISEFPLGTPPRPGHFPRRNRVIAGLSRAVVVLEASARSGSLGTARLAADEGRDVMAVPGHPSQAGAHGVNRLLRDGAVLVRDAADVAEELGLDIETGIVDPEDPVLAALAPDVPSSLDEILSRCGGAAGERLARLGQLELERRVRRLPGAVYVRS